MTMTGTLIPSLRSTRSTSIPPIRGICRSSNTKSGTSFRIAVRACSPLPAVATSHSSGRSLTSKSRREAASSSTISTRAPLVCIIFSHQTIHHRNAEFADIRACLHQEHSLCVLSGHEKKFKLFFFVILVPSFEDTSGKASVSLSRIFNGVIPAWTAGIQTDMDVSGCILTNLDAGNPCRHDDDLYFYVV